MPEPYPTVSSATSRSTDRGPGKLPYRDSTIIARLAWSYVPSEEHNRVFGCVQSFVAGPPINLQIVGQGLEKMHPPRRAAGVSLNSRDGKPADAATRKTCFGRHEPAKARDFAFTHYSPSPKYKQSIVAIQFSPQFWATSTRKEAAMKPSTAAAQIRLNRVSSKVWRTRFTVR